MLEIRIGMRVLLLGRPGAIPAPLLRASDGLALRSFYARLAQDRLALNRLRAGWRSIAPGMPTTRSDRVSLVDQLRRHVEAGQIKAALLDPRGQMPAASPAEKAAKPKLIHLKGLNEDLILAPSGTLPGQIRSLVDNPGAAAFLRQLGMGHPIETGLFRHAKLLGGNEGMAPVNLRQMVVAQIQQGRLDAVLIRSQIHRSMAAPVLPRRDVAGMDRTAKVAEAIQRSLPFLQGDVHAAVVEMCQPANLMIMAGVFAAMGLAQLYPPAGLAVDAAVFITAAFTIGWKSVEMLRAAVEATVVALGANDDHDLDRAGRLYADAFEALGAVAIAALTARFAGKKVGKAIEERQGAQQAAQRQAAPRQPREPVPESKPPPEKKPPAAAAKTAAQIAAERRATAEQFYRKAGWSDEKIAGHLDGIDFSKPVEVVTIPKGTKVVQYQIPGRPVGNYFCPEGSDPAKLGIDTGGRVAKVFETEKDIPVLRSTAKDIPDWRGSGTIFKGGGTQFFSPEAGNGFKAIGS